jgi:elongation factor G
VAGDVTNPLEIVIEAEAPADWERLKLAVEMLAAVDVYVGMMQGPAAGEVVLMGPDESYLEFTIGRLRRELGVALRVGPPQIGYRETLGHRTEIDHTHKELYGAGATGVFARVKMAFEPRAPRSGYRFENRASDKAVPHDLARGVEEGVEEARRLGAIHGFSVIDFAAVLLDGNFHDVDSSARAFAVAGGAAFKASMKKADCKLLEPIMKVDVALPKTFADEIIGTIVADLDQRRCEHHGLEDRGDISVLHAFVPLANMLGYGNTLRTLTQRRLAYGMVFDHYAPVPMDPDDGSFRPAVGMRA